MVVDMHVHMPRPISAKDALADMDAAGIDKAVFISPYGDFDRKKEVDDQYKLRMDSARQRKSIDCLGDLIKEAPDRIRGLVWIEPTLPDAADAVEYAIVDKKCSGVKMIPYHWYPYDEKLFPVYERIQKLRVPILFHAGILWGFEDSSRFCRPANYEVMLHFPKIRFALAHIGWPWTDECLAVAGRFRFAIERDDPSRMQMIIDTTRGTPEFYRKDALDKAIQYLGIDSLAFGSDSSSGKMKGTADDHVTKDRAILDSLGVSKDAQERYFSKTIERFFEPMA